MPSRTTETTRIARELHDVVAHELSAIAVQAEAAQAALAHDARTAAGILTAIRGAAHEALDDMRRLLAVTRDPGEPCERLPQPSLSQVGRLVEAAQAGGQPVALLREGVARALPASLELTAFRVLQEALANACRRAPGAQTTVRIAWLPEALELEVADTGGGGRRAAAMRERVRLHGGELRAGTGRRGGYRVRASFPLAA